MKNEMMKNENYKHNKNRGPSPFSHFREIEVRPLFHIFMK